MTRERTWNFGRGADGIPRGVVASSGLRGVLYKTSLLKFVNLGSGRLGRDHVSRTLAGIARVPKMPGPVFTFAHVMSPHDPYNFDRDCRPAREKSGGSLSQLEAAAYVEQIQCVDRLVLDLVTTLLRTSELPPVILLQGDHGSKTLLPYKDRGPENITLAAGKERLGAFGAYYLPDQGSEVFEDSVTVVNVVGNVLRFISVPICLGNRMTCISRCIARRSLSSTWTSDGWRGRIGRRALTAWARVVEPCAGDSVRRLFRPARGLAQLVEQGTFNP